MVFTNIDRNQTHVNWRHSRRRNEPWDPISIARFWEFVIIDLGLSLINPGSPELDDWIGSLDWKPQKLYENYAAWKYEEKSIVQHWFNFLMQTHRNNWRIAAWLKFWTDGLSRILLGTYSLRKIRDAHTWVNANFNSVLTIFKNANNWNESKFA